RNPIPGPGTASVKALCPAFATISCSHLIENARHIMTPPLQDPPARPLPHQDAAGLELAELEDVLAGAGFPRFHARQVYRWIHRRGVTDVGRMTDLSRALRSYLDAAWTITTPRIAGDH